MLDNAALLFEAVTAAKDSERATGMPAIFTLAQWALESGSGKHSPGHNCFGITAYEGCYGKQFLQTTEYVGGRQVRMSREFAMFPSLTDCFIKHAELLTSSSYYAGAWQMYQRNHDVDLLAHGVAVHYATDPDYGHKLVELMHSVRLREALSND